MIVRDAATTEDAEESTNNQELGKETDMLVLVDGDLTLGLKQARPYCSLGSFLLLTDLSVMP